MRSDNWGKYMLVVTVAAGLIFSMPAGSFAAKANFTAGVNPATLDLSVNAQGGITGTKTVTVDVHRKQVGSSYACNKIQTVEVLRGIDPLPPDETLVLSSFGGFPDRKGRCYFDINLTAQPFSDDEIRGACQGVSSGDQSLVADGLVTAWNKSQSYITSIRDMRKKGGTGGVGPKNRKQVRFAATVNCAASGSGTSSGGFGIKNPGRGLAGGFQSGTPVIGPRSGTGTTGSTTQCDLSGAWDGYNNGTRTTGWQFDQIFTSGGSVTYRATHLSAQRAPTGGEGAITRSSSGNYLFHTLLTKIPSVNGNYQASTMRIYDADASCGKLTERQLFDTTTGKVNRPGTYWLQRVSIPSKPTSPVGKPTGARKPFKPRTAPTKPGDTFQQKPNTPKW